MQKFYDNDQSEFRKQLFYIMAITQCFGNVFGVAANYILHGFTRHIYYNGLWAVVTFLIVAWTLVSRKIEIGMGILIVFSSFFEFPFLYMFNERDSLPYFMAGIVSVALFCRKGLRLPAFFCILIFDIVVMVCAPVISPRINIVDFGGYYSCISAFVIIACAIFAMVTLLVRQYEKKNDELLGKGNELIIQNELLEESEKKAKDANKAKSMFLASMSHEIRTPINTIIGMNEMILRESNDPVLTSYALDVRTSSKNLLELVNEILDISKIESGKLEIVHTKYELKRVLIDVIKMFSSKAIDKNLEFVLDIDSSIPNILYGDDMRIREILVNLLSNAIKYTDVGRISLCVSGDISGDFVDLYFEVVDTGRGIKKEDIQKIYDAYDRVDEFKNRHIEGTGLGINITNRLLVLMGSKLEVESEFGRGSRFFFKLRQEVLYTDPIGPINKDTKVNKEYSYNELFCAPEAKILLVDDNEMNRRVFRSLLKQTKVNVTELEDGESCLKIIEKEKFDIIFLDHMMPGIDGITTLHRMKENPNNKCKDTPVIVLTANAIAGSKDMYMEAGFDDFLSKPIYVDLLEHMIRKYLPNESIVKRKTTLSNKEADIDARGAENNKKISAAKIEAIKKLYSIEGFDWNYTKALVDDDIIFFDMVCQFKQILPETRVCLMDYVNDIENTNNLEQYRIKVHSLKNNAASVGELLISQLSKLLEMAAKESNYERIKLINPILIEKIIDCEKRLEFLNEYNNKMEFCEDLIWLRNRIQDLGKFVTNMDFSNADIVMQDINSKSYEEKIQSNINKLAREVYNLNVDEVNEICEMLETVL